MKRIILLICWVYAACSPAASPNDDMIEPSEETLLFGDSSHTEQLLDEIDAYAHSIGLEGSRKLVILRDPFSILSGYESPLETRDRPRSIYVLRNSRTGCIKIGIRVWDDLQTEEANKMRTVLGKRIESAIADSIETRTEQSCSLPF